MCVLPAPCARGEEFVYGVYLHASVKKQQHFSTLWARAAFFAYFASAGWRAVKLNPALVLPLTQTHTQSAECECEFFISVRLLRGMLDGGGRRRALSIRKPNRTSMHVGGVCMLCAHMHTYVHGSLSHSLPACVYLSASKKYLLASLSV
jgi:hypothetical protein